MKNLAALLVIACIAVLVLIFVTNPDLLNKIWLYIIGFIGYVVVLVEKGYKKIASALTPNKEVPKIPLALLQTSPPTSTSIFPEKLAEELKPEQKIKDLEIKLQEAKSVGDTVLGKSTLTVLRYLDDGETTLGLIFLRNKFFAYTLEDTHNYVKIEKLTRIPSGIYTINFNKNEIDLTEKYKNLYGSWFDFHLEIQHIPNFQNVFIHVGNTHQNTDGCILIADGVSAGTTKSLQYSRDAFERFYKTVSALLKSNEPVTIQILNEDWFEKSKLSSL
ncbi:DUF5675 family protein [Aquiflexum sp. TKW24L]|uniref:DUF5675 family protein n=1 Tax=Aquiflexum sp. TKW24L TaxID=2942212 RepID=UPI0020BE5313|nr:DUF5675 family protein [Aquiflexum sp. TKW24L]MCL6258120.1 DUF5675 family protein [Aquiflexum sp. TKW24L]